MATTIIIKNGYNTLAIPYSDKRVAALVDLMENATQVNVDWNGNITGATEPDSERFTFVVVRQEIPVYVPPQPETELEPELEPEQLEA